MGQKHYHINRGLKHHNKLRKILLSISCLLFAFGGIYGLLLTQSPELPIESKNDMAKRPQPVGRENYLKIERINLMIPFHEGKNEQTLENGAWHRFPERGNPEIGGNFILSGHRFRLGMTPNQTKDRSPFYHLDKLQNNDIIDVYFNGKWYSYKVQKLYSVKPEAVEIENPSTDAKLTLYTCSLKGSADGRVVIEAVPYTRSASL